MNKLKPCPFCGSQVKLDVDGFYMFCCDNCGAGITFAKVFEDGTAGDCDKDESISAWERRTQPANDPLTLKQLREELDTNPHGWLWLEALNDDAESLYQMNDTTSKWSNITNYSKTWLAYRRPPERSEFK